MECAVAHLENSIAYSIAAAFISPDYIPASDNTMRLVIKARVSGHFLVLDPSDEGSEWDRIKNGHLFVVGW
jgi:hypothetical protein